jgi:hypothetical protein
VPRPTPAQVPLAELKQNQACPGVCEGGPERASKWIGVLELGADSIADENSGHVRQCRLLGELRRAQNVRKDCVDRVLTERDLVKLGDWFRRHFPIARNDMFADLMARLDKIPFDAKLDPRPGGKHCPGVKRVMPVHVGVATG